MPESEQEKLLHVLTELGVPHIAEHFDTHRFARKSRPDTFTQSIEVARMEYCFDEDGTFLGTYHWSFFDDVGIFTPRDPVPRG